MPVQYSGYINERFSTEFKNINKELVDWLERTSQETNCRVDRKEWKSKYNSYVVYDYEPFCSDGFEINMVVSSYDVNYLNFLKYLFENKVKTIEYLKGCMTAWFTIKTLWVQCLYFRRRKVIVQISTVTFWVIKYSFD